MSFLGGLFGNNGSNFTAQSGNVINPLTGQAGAAVNQAQGAIGQQQALATALQQQGGVQNQQNVYNQLGQIASGQGANPAQAMLSQSTGQNVANQAALAAGQRGANQNVGLIARQAGQTGAAAQQNAAGQAATLQANQSLGALGQQAGIAGQQVGNQLAAQNALTNAAQGQSSQLIGANVAQNTASIQNAAQQNTSNAQIAGINAQGQQSLLGNVTGAVGSVAGLSEGGWVPHYANGGITQFNADTFGSQNPSNGTSNGGGASSSFGKALTGGGQSDWQSGKTGQKFGNALHSGFAKLFGSSSTPIADAAMQGVQQNSQLLGNGAAPSGAPTLGVDTSLSSAPEVRANDYPLTSDSQFTNAGPSLMAATLAHGGRVVPAMVSAGEKVIPTSEVEKVARHEKPAIQAGKTIHGKAKVAGDSIKNDTIPKNLAEGSIVLPRSVTQSAKPGIAAQRFVDTLLKKQGGPRKKAA